MSRLLSEARGKSPSGKALAEAHRSQRKHSDAIDREHKDIYPDITQANVLQEDTSGDW
jgi:hypothetical protein